MSFWGTWIFITNYVLNTYISRAFVSCFHSHEVIQNGPSDLAINLTGYATVTYRKSGTLLGYLIFRNGLYINYLTLTPVYYRRYYFLTLYVGSLMCVRGRFSSWRDTSGKSESDPEGPKRQVGDFLMCQMRRKKCVEGRFRAWCNRWGIPGCCLE